MMLYAASIYAGSDISAGVLLGWPSGGISDYAFGTSAIGVQGRFGVDAGGCLSVFGQLGCLDLGVEKGFVPVDGIISSLPLDTATDFYMIQFGLGLAIERKRGGFRPYIDFHGGAL
jgi:hypothetical protein